MTPDLDTARAFFAELYGEDAEGWVSFRSRPSAGGGMPIDWAPAGDLDALVAVVALRAPHGDLWFGVGTRRADLGPRARGGAGDILALPGLWLDVDIEGPGHRTDEPQPLDVEDALLLLKEHPQAPSVIVHSGGGLQPYWLFGENRPVAAVEPVLTPWHRLWARRAAERGWALDNVSGAAREMRVPGTFNLKTDTPRPVVLISA